MKLIKKLIVSTIIALTLMTAGAVTAYAAIVTWPGTVNVEQATGRVEVVANKLKSQKDEIKNLRKLNEDKEKEIKNQVTDINKLVQENLKLSDANKQLQDKVDKQSNDSSDKLKQAEKDVKMINDALGDVVDE